MRYSHRSGAAARLGLAAAILTSLASGAQTASATAGPVHLPAAAAPSTAALPRVAPGAAFHPLAPARIADSRTGKGGLARLRSGVPAPLQVTGAAGIPSGSVAVAANVTVVRPTHAGYLAVTPVQATPASASTSSANFAAGEIVATSITAPLGADGRLWLLYAGAGAADTSHVVVDITGYFSGAAGLMFHAVAPTRVADSTIARGLGPLRSGTPVALALRGVAGIPANATAIAGTIAVSRATASGYVALTPTRVAPASLTTSTLNVDRGMTRTNGITTPLGSDGALWFTYVSAVATDTAQVTLDVAGYFAPDTTGAVLHPAGPARIGDSRSGRGRLVRLSSGVPVALAVRGMLGVPTGTVALAGTLTAVRPRAAGSIALTPVKTPAASVRTASLSFAAADIRAAGVTAPLGADGVLWMVYAGGAPGDSVDVIFDLTGFFAPQTAASQIVPEYFRTWLPSASWIKDANGVIVVDYGGSVGRQYNPEAIAAGAIAYYDRWQFVAESDAQKAADARTFYTQLEWLVANQTADGRWLYRFAWGSQALPWWSAIDQGTAMSALIRGYALTGDGRYLKAVQLARTTFERPRERQGVTSSVSLGGKAYLVYEEYMPGYEPRVLNGWMFGIVGLYEAAVYLNDPMAYADLLSADRGTSAVAALLPYYDTGSWSYYSLHTLTGSPRGPRASMTYHDIHIGQLQFLGSVTGDPVLVRYAAKFTSYVTACRASGTCPSVAVAAIGASGLVADPFIASTR